MSRAGMAVLLGCVLIMMALVLPALSAHAGPADVCPGLDSGKIDVSGEQTSITVTAPAGYLIDEYCVKAGSVQGGTGGPVIVAVNPPQKSVTITYPSGKAISHYSVSYVPISTPTTPPPTCTSNCTPPPSCTHDCTPPPSKHVTPAVHPTAKAGAEAVATYPLQPVKGGVTTEQVSDDAVLTPVRAALVMLGLLAFWFALSGRLPRVKRVKPSRRDS
ncbi:MAG TPA: hypothetical protein VNC14_05450 [Lapillicoccus sp.]|nr:hypothetical protein [Lapillicoccus sp.]